MEKKLTHSKWFLYLTEFFAGMSVMAVELGASRLMAPYFSSSQIVWTVIIGVIMVAMAVGNIWGGRMADKSKSPDRLYGRVIIAAIWIALIPFAGRWMIAGISFLLATFVTKNFLVWAALAACLVLNAYIPMLSGTGGNSGTQASVAVIRALSLDEVDFSDVFRVLWKELRVSLLCGVCLAGANFVKMLLVDRLLLGNAAVTPLVCLVVCLTILFVVVFAKCVGCSLPLLAEKVGLDPAVMASPFISTIVDATSLLIYFSFASALLGI